MKELLKLIKKAKYVYVAGNGGSASLANHFACDLVKVGGIRAVSLSSNVSLLTAYANDNGFENVFSDQLKVFLSPDDLLITISASGTSKNITKAVQLARKVGVGVYSFPTMNDKKLDMRGIEDLHLQIAHKIIEAFEESKT